MPVSPARAAAFDILFRVERESSFASELLHSAALDRISTADHGLATELVMGVLRWRSSLDDEIASASAQPLAKLDLEILIALRLALYQFRHLDRIPPRAALHESVELVKRSRKRSAAAFVNAVLRKLSTSMERWPGSRDVFDSAESIAKAFAHPLWLVERWVHEYGLAAASQICEHNQSIPEVAVRLRTAAAEGQLAETGIVLAPGKILQSARLLKAGDITKAAQFRSREIVIQDEASQLVAILVGEGSDILDCCAAPGGKTLAISDRNLHSPIVAVELHPHRARLLQTLLAPRAGTQIRVIAADARSLPLSQQFDRVLADVPCTGTGTLARNPEIKWRLKPDDISNLQERQRAILKSAMAQVAPKGRLVYSTCSLEREENEDVVEHALKADSLFELVDCEAELKELKASGELTWPEPASLTCGPYLRTIPGIHPCEGFFAAILHKQ
jgi:16S rRNA (cytosine967-C5)-methyltransferase